MTRTWIAILLFITCIAPQASAAELVSDTQTFSKAEVVDVLETRTEELPGLSVTHTLQRLRAVFLEGEREGEEIELVNDYVMLERGDVFYLRHTTNSLDGTDYYSVADPYRIDVLSGLFILFLLCLFFFGGLQGLRGLLALAGSLVLIVYVLLPGILAGYSPILVALSAASLIVIAGSYITHGVSRMTTAAVLGMLVTVAITGALAYLSVDLAHLTGYAQEESVYLRFGEGAGIDLAGLLLAGIMIGLLGVLYDIAIGQAVAVEELMRHGKLSPRDAYTRAIRIGREHIGALVNTLAIAYVGAAMPLLLLFKLSQESTAFILNGEVFAAEIVRTLVGSIGLILAVPITTAIAVYLVRGESPSSNIHTH